MHVSKNILCSSLLLLLVNSAFATDYYIKSGGDDGSAGTSDGAAWATIAKINDFAEATGFQDGDTINFNRGDTWQSDEAIGHDGSAISWGTIVGLTIQDYGTGDLPRIDCNTQRGLYIYGENVSNLTVKNIDFSGMDWNSTDPLVWFISVNGVTMDGVYIDGHVGASSYARHEMFVKFSCAEGAIEIKNSTFKNNYKDTFANTLSAWGATDGALLEFWVVNGGAGKVSGAVSIHDNTFSQAYSDCIQFAGTRSGANIYDNTFLEWGEQAIDLKGSQYVNIYQNHMSWNGFGSSAGESSWGASIIGGQPSEYFDGGIGYFYIYSNDFYDSNLNGMHFGSAYTLNVYDNYFKDIGLPFVKQTNGSNQHFYNNVIELTETIGSSTQLDAYPDAAIVIREGGTGNTVYNNTIYISHSDYEYGIHVYNNAGVTIQNNVIQMARDSSSVYPLYSNSSAITVDHNVFYGAHANRVYWAGTAYTTANFSTWAASHTGDTSGDPGLENVGSGQLWLASIESAAATGATTPITANGLVSTSTWTPTINIVTAAWTEERGAYVLNPISSGGTVQTGLGGSNISSDQIITGGNTITFQIYDQSWVTPLTDELKATLIAGLDAQADQGDYDWNTLIRDDAGEWWLDVGAVVLADDTITITLPAFATYDIASNETIISTIDSTLITDATEDIVASPDITISAVQASTSTSAMAITFGADGIGIVGGADGIGIVAE